MIRMQGGGQEEWREGGRAGAECRGRSRVGMEMANLACGGADLALRKACLELGMLDFEVREASLELRWAGLSCQYGLIRLSPEAQKVAQCDCRI